MFLSTVKGICNKTMKAKINIRRYNRTARVIDQTCSIKLVLTLTLGLASGFLATKAVGDLGYW